jgi:hypothetical protein
MMGRTQFSPVEQAGSPLSETLSEETELLLGEIDERIASALGHWTIFRGSQIFQLLTAQVMDSDPCLLGRLEHLSNEEGCGAEIIRGFIGHRALTDHATAFQRHVDDEILHQHHYGEMARTVAFEFGLPAPHLHSTDPIQDLGIDYEEDILLHVLSIHIGELRNLLNMDLMIPILLGSADKTRQWIGEKMLAIRADEIGHIRYLSTMVGHFLDAGLIHPAQVQQMVDEYDQFWWEDVARSGKALADARRAALLPQA